MSAANVVRLYDRTAALDVIREWIFEHDEEIRAAEGALPDELAELLKQAEGEFEEKAENVALFIRELSGLAKFAKEEADRLAARREHYERSAKGLKDYLHRNLTAAGITKIEGKLCNIGIQKNPPAVKCSLDSWKLAELHEAEPDIVHERVEYFIDTDFVKATWKAGGALPAGISVEQGTHLRIR